MTDPGFTRRTLLGAAAGLAGATPLLGACADGSARRSGVLQLGLGGAEPTETLDFTRTTDSVGVAVNFALWNGLVENGPDNKPIPELAQSWEAQPGAAEWVFNLRKGVKFSNGQEFTADDAIYSLNLHRGPANKSGAADLLKVIADVRKLDPHQIGITLTSGYADLPAMLTEYHILMVPAGYNDWAHPIGTGSMLLESFDPGVHVALTRNPDYWKPDRGHVDGVVITVINDADARLDALLSGQVDAINRVPPGRVHRLTADRRLQVVRAPSGWFAEMSMMVDRDPYSSAAMRKALKLAVDREAIVQALFSGYGSLGNDHPIPMSDPFHNSELPQTKYDPDQARYYFRQSGISAPKIVLQASDAAFRGAEGMATLLRNSAQQAGIDVEVRNEPADGFWDGVWLKGSFVTCYWAGRPAATQMLDVAFKSDAAWNETHWRNPHFDDLLANARTELDVAKRRSAIYDMQAMLHDDGGMIIPAFRDWLDAHSDRVGGHTPHSGLDMDNGRICEKAWLNT